MDRRSFLSLCSLAGLGFASPIGTRAFAGEGEQAGELPPYAGPFYVVFNASGGWDTSYLMDPKGVEGINRLYQSGDIQSAGSIRFAPTAKHIEKGMSNEAFFAKYAPELLVLNGLDLSVNNHTPGARYMATGKLDSVAYPTFAALVAACRGGDAPLAFLTFGNYSATGNLVPMSRVPYLQSLNVLAAADAVGGSTHMYHDAFAADRIEKSLQEQFDARVSTTRLPRVERSQSMLYSAQVNSKALRRVLPYIPKQPSQERLAQQADIALAGFKAGVCVSANLTISQFDSHANNDRDQMKLIPELLAGIDYLLIKAEELQIRDQIVVVMQSEMGRTPNYNEGQGKDHWSIGSVMFLGPAITGNRVIGATDEKQFPLPLTQEASDRELRFRPEHVHEFLRRYAKIDGHAFATQFPLNAAELDRMPRLF